MFRIKDPKISLDFYTRVMGMKFYRCAFQDATEFLGCWQNMISQRWSLRFTFWVTVQWTTFQTHREIA